MKIHFRAALLSAFVLPGLGQLYKGDRIKGVIIIILVNIFLLLAVYLVLRQVGPLVVAARMPGFTEASKIAERLQAGTPAVRYLLAGFGGLWLYSLVDAAVGNRGKE
jgi:TM2 domain-containing membrane protein YozV